MKGTTETTGSERRGLFRRGRRAEDVDSPAHASDATDRAVATVDDLARRMDELVAQPAVADEPVRADFDLQRAVIARANDLAATSTTGATQPVETAPAPSPTVPTTPQTATEAPVQQPTSTNHDAETMTSVDDIEARMDAALQPVALPTVEPTPAAPVAQSVTLDPTPAPAQAEQAPAAELQATRPTMSTAGYVSGSSNASAAAAIGIDVHRILQLIEDEATGVQHRIELELRTAHARAEEVVDRAEDEAERIREHGQTQARVLLGEVEEIISEAQQTGEQILLRANEEASSLRGDATSVLHQAQTEARAIVDTARREGEQVLAEQRRLATVRAQEAMREQDRLKDQIRRLEERRRQVLESLEPLISQLTQMMPTTIAGGADPQNVVQLQRQQPHG